MNAQRVLSRHRVHFSVRHLSTNNGEGGRQDKSRKLWSGRSSEEANKCNLLAQGARKPLTFLKEFSHWERCDPCTLQVGAA